MPARYSFPQSHVQYRWEIDSNSHGIAILLFVPSRVTNSSAYCVHTDKSRLDRSCQSILAADNSSASFKMRLVCVLQGLKPHSFYKRSSSLKGLVKMNIVQAMTIWTFNILDTQCRLRF